MKKLSAIPVHHPQSGISRRKMALSVAASSMVWASRVVLLRWHLLIVSSRKRYTQLIVSILLLPNYVILWTAESTAEHGDCNHSDLTGAMPLHGTTHVARHKPTCYSTLPSIMSIGALLLAPASGDLLQALPLSSFSNQMDNTTVRIVAGLRHRCWKRFYVFLLK